MDAFATKQHKECIFRGAAAFEVAVCLGKSNFYYQGVFLPFSDLI